MYYILPLVVELHPCTASRREPEVRLQEGARARARAADVQSWPRAWTCCGMAQQGAVSLRMSPSAALNCTKAVPTPVDVAPVRTPQALHTALLKHVADKDIIEIGTRNGDGMACFAQVAKRAVAIEVNSQYCAKLRARSDLLVRSNQRGFSVVCSRYQDMSHLDADVVTWWQQPPFLRNSHLLRELLSRQADGTLRPTAIAVLAFDPTFPTDARDLRVYTSLRACVWHEAIDIDEEAPCRARNRTHFERANLWRCARARGVFHVAALRLSDPSLFGALAGRLTNATVNKVGELVPAGEWRHRRGDALSDGDPQQDYVALNSAVNGWRAHMRMRSAQPLSPVRSRRK